MCGCLPEGDSSIDRGPTGLRVIAIRHLSVSHPTREPLKLLHLRGVIWQWGRLRTSDARLLRCL